MTKGRAALGAQDPFLTIIITFNSAPHHQHQLLTALKESLAYCVSCTNDFSLPIEKIFESLRATSKGDKASRAATAECLGFLMILNRDSTLGVFTHMMSDGSDKSSLSTVVWLAPTSVLSLVSFRLHSPCVTP